MSQRFWKEEPTVLLVGSVDHEGVRSALTLSGRRYRRKELHSNPSNWQSIVDLFLRNEISSVLVKLTGLTYRHLLDDDYSSVADILLEQIATVPHIVFVYEGLFTGKDESEWGEIFDDPGEATRIAVNAMLARHSLRVVTYKRNSELTILAQEFLSHTETGLLLRLYIPHAQLWADETNRLLRLFRDYLTRVASLDIRLEECRTNTG